MTEQLVNINGLSYRPSTRLGECGAKPEWRKLKKLYFPMFLMGACGIDDCVYSWNGDRELLEAPKKMDYEWFEKLSKKLKKNAMLDWDWYSFSKNILEPNREHLKVALNINDEKVDLLLGDGYVFINHFEDTWEDECDEEELEDIKKKGFNYPNFKNFLEKDELEY